MTESQSENKTKGFSMNDLALELYNQSARGDRLYPADEIEIYYRPFVYTKQDKFWQLKKILRLVRIFK